MGNILLLVLMCYLNVAFATDNTKAYFPVSESGKFPRLRLIGSLPVLREFTFCSWVRIYNMTGRSPFVLSYATPVSDNEIAILFHTVNSHVTARLHIGSPLIDFECSMLDSGNQNWNHLCVTWFAPTGKADVFINNYKCIPTTKTHVSTGGLVRSGGIAIVGQDQDAMDSKFDPNQAWYGDIADIHMWDEVLSREQIEEAGKCGGRRKKGNVIAWLKTSMTAIDGAAFTETQLCQP